MIVGSIDDPFFSIKYHRSPFSGDAAVLVNANTNPNG